MPDRNAQQRRGFVLAEALIALIIVGIVFIALEGSLTLVLRSLADSRRETVAARLAENEREHAFASVCAPASGVDSMNAVVVDWVASPSGRLVHVAQTSRYRPKSGDRIEHYDAIGACQ